jgi:hypothetical protein
METRDLRRLVQPRVPVALSFPHRPKPFAKREGMPSVTENDRLLWDTNRSWLVKQTGLSGRILQLIINRDRTSTGEIMYHQTSELANALQAERGSLHQLHIRIATAAKGVKVVWEAIDPGQTLHPVLHEIDQVQMLLGGPRAVTVDTRMI